MNVKIPLVSENVIHSPSAAGERMTELMTGVTADGCSRLSYTVLEEVVEG